MDFVIGCDEAGRGCLLGALVMTAFSVEAKRERELKEAGARDSKEMTPESREAVRKKIEKIGEHRTVTIPATLINSAMERKISLNELEAREISVVLSAVVAEIEGRGDRVAAIYLDSPDPIPEKYAKRVRKAVPPLEKIKIISDNKSENKHPYVAAASVIAKTTRDDELRKIKEEFGEDFGTGYTHDAKTIDFARRHLRDPRLAPYLRTRWKTVRNLQSVQIDLNEFL